MTTPIKTPVTWRQFFAGMAGYVATKSKDTTKVGAVAAGPDNEVLETAYNGLPRYVEDLPERMERPAKYLWTAHAEENLVAAAARPRLKGATIYVTHLCCCACARMIINAGVLNVVCGNGKTAMPPEQFEVALQMFKEANVTVVYEDSANG